MSFNGCKRVKLKDCVSFQEGYVNPSQSVPEYFGNEIKWLRANDLNNSFVYDTSRKLSRKGFESAGKSAYLFKPNSLAISKSGTIGRLGILQDYMCGNRAVINIEVNNEVSDTFFIFYNLLLRQSLIEQMGTGSVQKNLYISVLGELEIDLPDLSTQRRIADILSALDEKIELNRQTNATLEAIAQSIFREWFVDGEDIDDWEVGKLGDIAENIRRSVQPSEIEPDTPYIGLEHMPRKSIALSEWDTASDVVSNKYLFKQDEFLFGKLRPYFHKVGVAPLDGVSSTDILVVAPKEDDYYGVVLGHISSVDLINHTTAASTGTKMPRTNWSDIARYEIALPPKERAKQFSGFMKPVIQLIQSNIMEARTLASIRDTLLPKLMSGEVILNAVS